jgi:membrane protease YdiL (CAAX protease family)
VLHALLAAAALLWLSLRDRGDALAEYAIGARGPWLAIAAGALLGWLGARLTAAVAPRLRRLREVEAAAGKAFAGARDGALLLFATAGALAEELFFRLAVLDCFGLWGSVAASVVVNSSLAGVWWLPFAALHAVVLALLVQHGFGLLASTAASAVMNYLNVRRIQCR